MKTPRDTVEYPIIVYQAWEKHQRRFDCVAYNDCLNIAANDPKSTGFGCKGCPRYRKSGSNEPEPSASLRDPSEQLTIGSMTVAMIYFGLGILRYSLTGDSL